MSYDSFLKRQVLEKFCNDKFHLTIHSDVTKTHIVFERHRSSLTFIVHHKVAIHLLSNVMQYNMCLLVLRWSVPQLCPRRGFQTHRQEPSPPSGDKYFVSTVKVAWTLSIAGSDYVSWFQQPFHTFWELLKCWKVDFLQISCKRQTRWLRQT